MNAFVLALRAVGAHIFMRIYIPVVVGAGIILALLAAGALWLTTLSAWWWLLFIPITSIFCIASAIAVVMFLLIRFVTPEQTKSQKRAVKNFSDKLQNIADIAGTPKIIILFRVARSVAAPSKESYLADLISNKDLVKEFRDLQNLFQA